MFRIQQIAEALAYNASQQYQQQPGLAMHHGETVVWLQGQKYDVTPAEEVEVSSRGGVTCYQYACMTAV